MINKEKLNGRRVYRDDNTGDVLNFSEYFSWRLQNTVIRRWWFLGIFTTITLACIATGSITVMAWWNVLASWLAIFVESIVGRAMSGQTKRDARIIRDIKNIELEDRQHHEAEDVLEGDVYRMVKEMYADFKNNKN